MGIPSTSVDATQSPFVVGPKKACHLLDCGNTRLYELLAQRELVSFKIGKSRKITVESIRAYIARRIAEGEGAFTTRDSTTDQHCSSERRARAQALSNAGSRSP